MVLHPALSLVRPLPDRCHARRGPHSCIHAHNSTGQSGALLMRKLGVRIPLGVPYTEFHHADQESRQLGQARVQRAYGI